jgi:predicted negative regulator of RcsB-dependent stress response
MSEDLQNTPRPLGEIAIGPSKFEQFLDRNQKGMIGLAIILALAGGGYIIHRGIERSKREDAGMALSKASQLTEFQAITKDFPGTPAAGSAELLAAEKQWDDKQPDAAIATLRQFISANPGHPAVPTAQASLGAKLVKQNQLAGAEAAFQAVVDNPSARFLAPYALIQLGDLAKTAGDLDKAERLYTQAKSDYSDNSFGRIADQHLQTLRAKPPVEIEAPAAPAIPAGQEDLLQPSPQAPFGGLPVPADEPAPAPAQP